MTIAEALALAEKQTTTWTLKHRTGTLLRLEEDSFVHILPLGFESPQTGSELHITASWWDIAFRPWLLNYITGWVVGWTNTNDAELLDGWALLVEPTSHLHEEGRP